MTATDHAAGLALVADGVSLPELERDVTAQIAAMEAKEPMTDEEAEPLTECLDALSWAIAEAPAHTRQDMAVKVRLWRLSIEDGEAFWDDRLAETLLEALER